MCHQVTKSAKNAAPTPKNNKHSETISMPTNTPTTKHRNHTIDWSECKTIAITNSTDKGERRKTSRSANKIVSSVLSCGDTKEQQCNALHAALLNPAIQPIAKSVIMNIVKSDNWTETKIGSDPNANSEINKNQCTSNDAKGLSNFVMNNFKKLICHVKGTNGRWSNVAEQFIRTVFTAISGGGSKTLDGFSDCVIEDVFGLTARTVKR